MSSVVRIKRRNQKIERDIARVICRLYIPGEDPVRVNKIIQRILRLNENEVETILNRLLDNFSKRHKKIHKIFDRHYHQVSNYISSNGSPSLSTEQKLLIGAYFTKEYSIESAALFNPSIVLHPDQSDLAEGSLRFIMSLRAVGEGHISSIVFRSGIIDQEGILEFDPVTPYVDTPNVGLNPYYDKHLFKRKLEEMGNDKEVVNYVLEEFPEHFNYDQLKDRVAYLSKEPAFEPNRQLKCFARMHRLVNSNYEADFHTDHPLSERVLFPVSEVESDGIEDARFVQFRDDDGELIYYATYTAYDGKNILPQLIETRDFLHFDISTLNGNAVQNKGMALFPRKINGRYAMLGRQDGENNYIMFSDHLHFWDESRVLQQPEESWEFIQIGNCGAPLETEKGWLVLTHGVGPMRVYSIGAILLDLDDPSKMIARLTEPLLRPYEREREGYVPNVLYTCGAILFHDQLIIPYSMSDIHVGIASVNVNELLSAMKPV